MVWLASLVRLSSSVSARPSGSSVSRPMTFPSGRRVHAFLLTEIPSQADLAEQLRMFETPEHALSERIFATPAGRPFALQMTFTPRGEAAP